MDNTDRSNAYWVIATIVFFLYCLFTQNWDLFLVTVTMIGLGAWVFSGMFSGLKKLAPRRKVFNPGKIVQDGNRPDGPMPAERVRQEVKVTVDAGEIETPAITISTDTRKNTVSATKALPKQITFVEPTGTTIPILYDGKRWHNVNLGKDGHWGVFGTTGSGKGNAIQLIALSALSLGPDKATLTILDGKGGLDYAFALDIEHATLYYGNDLEQGCTDVVDEMMRRNQVLMGARKRNVAEYNKANPDNPIPLQVVIADELLSFSDDGVEQLELFAAQCRAMGGVLIIATQQPNVDIIPTQIQANVTNRLVGRLVSSEYSRTALRRLKADMCIYEPAMIPKEYPGIMVLRQDSGNEILGRSPELTETLVSGWINDLVQSYPRINPMPQKPLQTATGAFPQGITTAPLADKEKQDLNDWEDEGISRREMARRLYKMRGGTGNYDGSGPIYQLIKRFLDLE